MTTIGFEVEEKVRLRGSVTRVDAQRPAVAILTDQLAAMSTRLLPLSTLSTPGLLSGMPASSEVNSDWPSRISLGPAMTSPQPWPRPTRKDLDDRLRESVTAEREASVRSKQQSTSLADLSARLQQQLDSSRANDERLSQSLRQRSRRSRLCCSHPVRHCCRPFRGATHHHCPRAVRLSCLICQPNVCRIWRQRRRWHPSRKPRVTGKVIDSFQARR